MIICFTKSANSLVESLVNTVELGLSSCDTCDLEHQLSKYKTYIPKNNLSSCAIYLVVVGLIVQRASKIVATCKLFSCCMSSSEHVLSTDGI